MKRKGGGERKRGGGAEREVGRDKEPRFKNIDKPSLAKYIINRMCLI